MIYRFDLKIQGGKSKRIPLLKKGG